MESKKPHANNSVGSIILSSAATVCLSKATTFKLCPHWNLLETRHQSSTHHNPRLSSLITNRRANLVKGYKIRQQ